MKIGVIMGGISSEREISLASGNEIINNLDKSKYEVVPVQIDSKIELIQKIQGVDVAFLALHGQFGEDGTVQSILEALNIPYTGCGVLSSSICMDKDITKRLIRDSGLNTADWVNVKSVEEIDFSKISQIGYPVVVKPNSGGSSVATFIIKEQAKLAEAVETALKYDKEVMIEKFISGDEITCTMIDGKMYPVLAIKPTSTFFDYTSKYSDGGASEVVIELEPKLQQTVHEMALKCYNVLKCSVYSRVDMIVNNGVPYILEVNTLPGMTKNSLIPKSVKSLGISFSQLLDMIIDLSLKEIR